MKYLKTNLILTAIFLTGCVSKPSQIIEWSNPKYLGNSSSQAALSTDSLTCKDNAYIEAQRVYVPPQPSQKTTSGGSFNILGGIQQGYERGIIKAEIRNAKRIKQRAYQRSYFSCMNRFGWTATRVGS